MSQYLSSAVLMFVTLPGVQSTDVSQEVVTAVEANIATVLTLPTSHVSIVWIAEAANNTATILEVGLIADGDGTQLTLYRAVLARLLTASGNAFTDAVIATLQSSTGLAMPAAVVSIELPSDSSAGSAALSSSSSSSGPSLSAGYIALILIAGGLVIAGAILVGAHLRQPLHLRAPSSVKGKYGAPVTAPEIQPLSPSKIV